MEKIILSLLIVIVLSKSANAQNETSVKKIKFSISINAGIPVGEIKPFSSFVI